MSITCLIMIEDWQATKDCQRRKGKNLKDNADDSKNLYLFTDIFKFHLKTHWVICPPIDKEYGLFGNFLYNFRYFWNTKRQQYIPENVQRYKSSIHYSHTVMT